MTVTPPGTAPLPELVVRWLGRVAVVGGVEVTLLIILALTQPGKVDAAIIGVIAGCLQLPSMAIGALGAILASTRAPSPTDPPTPVNVVNPPADPVPTSDVPRTSPRTKAPAKKAASARRRRHRGQTGLTDLQVSLSVLLGLGLVLLVVGLAFG